MNFLILLLLLCFVSAQALAGESVSDPKGFYEQLRAALLSERAVALEDVVLTRDVFEFHLDSGEFLFFEPVEGRVPGGVFVGEGRLVLDPATEGEREHLRVRTGEKGFEVLRDGFDSLVVWFTDDTEQELLSGQTAKAPTQASKAKRAVDAHFDWQKKKIETNMHVSIVRTLLNQESEPAEASFWGFFEGKKLGRMAAMIDPMGALDNEEVALLVDNNRRSGFFYANQLKRELEAGDASAYELEFLVDATHYKVDTTIQKSTDLAGTTTFEFKVLVPSLQVLPIQLARKLRIESASLVSRDGEPVAVPIGAVQEDEKEDAGAALLFSPPLKKGETVKVEVRYAGEGVLDDDGVGTYRVGARTSWYPNVGSFRDRATYELSFDVPKGNTVISVGERVGEETTTGNRTKSAWRSTVPMAVAGFNYGDFKLTETTEPNTGTRIEVWASTGRPDLITEINQILASAPSGAGPGNIGVSISGLTEAAMADAQNAVQLFTAFFGEQPFDRIAITQQAQWTFGQAWPTLIYLPYMAGFSSTMRMELGMTGASDFVDQVGLHEMAHQWWGHLIGWESYRDQWLSESFAQLSTAMALEAIEGQIEHQKFWEGLREQVVEKRPGSQMRPFEAGPISLGWRASTHRSPGAYQANAYAKGAYVLHMLRMLMRDAKDQQSPDRRFLAMMRDFIQSHAGTDPSTADFQAAVEKHMVPELNAAGNGTLDWFFDQWVHGTAVPSYDADFKIEKAGRGEYRIVGTLSQKDVPNDFLALVPLYVDLGKDSYGMFGRAPMRGEMSRDIDVTLPLPKKPKRVVANAYHDVLSQ